MVIGAERPAPQALLWLRKAAAGWGVEGRGDGSGGAWGEAVPAPGSVLVTPGAVSSFLLMQETNETKCHPNITDQ